jgi:DNA-binding MarR family transcriptional regulator
VVAEHLPLARLLSVVLRQVIDDLHDELEAQGFRGLRPAYGYALAAIDGGTATAAELGSHLGMTKQGAAKLLDALEADRYIRRLPPPDDRRAKLVVVSPRGRRLLEASARAQQAVEDRWAQTLGRRAANTLRSQLETLSETSAGERRPLRPPW